MRFLWVLCLFVVPPLEGFVMNRILGDYFETLLYKIFVSIDEYTSISEVQFKFKLKWGFTCGSQLYSNIRHGSEYFTVRNSFSYIPCWELNLGPPNGSPKPYPLGHGDASLCCLYTVIPLPDSTACAVSLSILLILLYVN